jgi:cytochrome c556
MKPTVKTHLICALLFATPLLSLVYRQPTPHAATANGALPQPNLRQLMQEKIHVEFTQISFTIWHDRPLTPSKMESISASATRMAGFANDLQPYSTFLTQQGWSKDDAQFFDQQRLQLSHVSTELDQAARRRDQKQITSFFMHLETTCNTCHHRFRPDLSYPKRASFMPHDAFLTAPRAP